MQAKTGRARSNQASRPWQARGNPCVVVPPGFLRCSSNTCLLRQRQLSDFASCGRCCNHVTCFHLFFCVWSPEWAIPVLVAVVAVVAVVVIVVTNVDGNVRTVCTIIVIVGTLQQGGRVPEQYDRLAEGSRLIHSR